MGMTPEDLMNDPTLVCTDPAIDAARLSASGPPPHTCCPMAPAGVKNGGEQMNLDQSPLAQQLLAALPAPAVVPACKADATNAFSGNNLLPETKPAPAPGATS